MTTAESIVLAAVIYAGVHWAIAYMAWFHAWPWQERERARMRAEANEPFPLVSKEKEYERK